MASEQQDPASSRSRTTPTVDTSTNTDASTDTVPFGVRVAAAWSWRGIVIVVFAAILVWLLSQVHLLIIPMLIATLLSALLLPLKEFLVRHKWHNGVATAVVILALIVVVVGALTLVGRQLFFGFRELSDKVMVGLESIQGWLKHGPLHLRGPQLDGFVAQLENFIKSNSPGIVHGAVNAGRSAGEVGAGVLLTLFALIFFLLEGRRIFTFMVRLLVPRAARQPVTGAADAGWTSLGNYVRVQIFVALVDAVGIAGIGALIHVPLALPIGVLIFFASFVPIVGALFSGLVVVILALVANGIWSAVLMLVVVLAVHELENHVLQPLVMGKAVHLHPLAVVLAVAGGTLIAGIPGALLSVPALAFVSAAVRYLSHKPWQKTQEAPSPELDGSADPAPAATSGTQD